MHKLVFYAGTTLCRTPKLVICFLVVSTLFFIRNNSSFLPSRGSTLTRKRCDLCSLPFNASDWGPFQNWDEAFEVSKQIQQRDIQQEIGAPIRKEFAKSQHETPAFADWLPEVPKRCKRFVQPASPVNIDVALGRMMGSNPQCITRSQVRDIMYTKHDYYGNTLYRIRNGVMYYDKRTIHPKDCFQENKMIGVVNLLSEAHTSLSPVDDISFRFVCRDNPIAPWEAQWSYSTMKDPDLPTLAWPDDHFVFYRWHKNKYNWQETPFDQKPKHAEWRGSNTGYLPFAHLYEKGFLEPEPPASLKYMERITPRKHFIRQYDPKRLGKPKDSRITASFERRPMDEMANDNRVLFSLAGNSYASNSLDVLMANSVVLQQDFPTMSWEESFFTPGLHYLSIPRSLDDKVIQKALDLVFKDDKDMLEFFTNMTRLASTVADIVANDNDLGPCFAHRAASLWKALQSPSCNNLDKNGRSNMSRDDVSSEESLDLEDDHFVPLIDLAQAAIMTPEEIRTEINGYDPFMTIKRIVWYFTRPEFG